MKQVIYLEMPREGLMLESFRVHDGYVHVSKTFFFFFCLAKSIGDFQSKVHRENGTIYRWPLLSTLPSFSSFVPCLLAMMACGHLRYIETHGCGPSPNVWDADAGLFY